MYQAGHASSSSSRGCASPFIPATPPTHRVRTPRRTINSPVPRALYLAPPQIQQHPKAARYHIARRRRHPLRVHEFPFPQPFISRVCVRACACVCSACRGRPPWPAPVLHVRAGSYAPRVTRNVGSGLSLARIAGTGNEHYCLLGLGTALASDKGDPGSASTAGLCEAGSRGPGVVWLGEGSSVGGGWLASASCVWVRGSQCACVRGGRVGQMDQRL